jgi:uncharacterized protein (TIGR02271 family)
MPNKTTRQGCSEPEYMGSTTHSIEVNAPVRAAYNQWTQFEEFPKFMEGVEEVRQEDNKRLFWKVKIAGKVKEWEAEITDQVPDQRIAWQSLDGSPNAGTVRFEQLGPDRTLVTATIEYEPEGFFEKTGDALGIPSARVEGDLKRFRDFIEERGRETGAWRGQIGEGETPSLGSTQAARPERDFRPATETARPSAEAANLSQNTAAAESKVEGDKIEVPLSEEEVKIGKRKVSAGDVRVRKNVKTEQVSVPVELRREEAVIERVGASETRPPEKEPFQEERIEVPLSREEPVVEKQTHVTGGVRIRKTEGVEQQTIQEKVRREDVDIDESGKVSDSRKGRIDPETEKEKL